MPYYTTRFRTTEADYEAITRSVHDGHALRLVPTPKLGPSHFDVLAGPELIGNIFVEYPTETEADDA